MPSLAALLSGTAVLGGAFVVCAVLRPRLHKDLGHALVFAAPAAVLTLSGSALLPADGLIATGPLWSGALLCMLAAWCFFPTRRSRFREFEAAFWAHVSGREQFGARE